MRVYLYYLLYLTPTLFLSGAVLSTGAIKFFCIYAIWTTGPILALVPLPITKNPPKNHKKALSLAWGLSLIPAICLTFFAIYKSISNSN